MRRYRVLLPLTVHTEAGSYSQFDEFEKTFTPEEEAANLDSGLLELVAVEYRVVGNKRVLETEPGGVFTAALRMTQEHILIEGGHIERVEETTKQRAQRKKEK